MELMTLLYKGSRKGLSMEGRNYTLKALILAAIASCVICTSSNSLSSDKTSFVKCTSEASSKVCLACAAANLGITEDACCEETDARRLCEDLLNEGEGAEKRAKYFLGKRDRYNFLAKRPKAFLGKRADEEEDSSDNLSEDKRSRMPFLGKRGSQEEEEEKRGYSPFLGKRGSQEEEEEKRGYSPFLGKRARMPFLGKRRNPFLGKRNDAENDEKDKRPSAFLGKRSVDDDEFTPVDYLEEKRANPFLGKRMNPFLGKRSQPFLGKRNGYDGLESEVKRAKYFLGKRDGNLSGEDLDTLVKRAKYFLGKRPKYFLG